MAHLKKYDSLDRSLEKALTNQLIDKYFDHTESWLRAILRKCIFSLAYVKKANQMTDQWHRIFQVLLQRRQFLKKK